MKHSSSLDTMTLYSRFLVYILVTSSLVTTLIAMPLPRPQSHRLHAVHDGSDDPQIGGGKDVELNPDPSRGLFGPCVVSV